MANYKHMNLDDRIEIQKGLKEGKSFAEIGAAIACQNTAGIIILLLAAIILNISSQYTRSRCSSPR